MSKLKVISAIEAELILINIIKENYEKVRQAGKSPTFLLQFSGTMFGLMKIFGFSKAKAKEIYDAYVSMYQVSINWTLKKIRKAHKKGYTVGAFNLRLATPILKQTAFLDKNAPSAAKAEARSAGNMVSGQSYGILTLRAFANFMNGVRASKKWKYKIFPWATIYDSIYVEAPLTVDAIYYVNKNLIHHMRDISECDELKHPVIKMGAELVLFYPSWADEIHIPRNASKKAIRRILKENKVKHE